MFCCLVLSCLVLCCLCLIRIVIGRVVGWRGMSCCVLSCVVLTCLLVASLVFSCLRLSCLFFLVFSRLLLHVFSACVLRLSCLVLSCRSAVRTWVAESALNPRSGRSVTSTALAARERRASHSNRLLAAFNQNSQICVLE